MSTSWAIRYAVNEATIIRCDPTKTRVNACSVTPVQSSARVMAAIGIAAATKMKA